MSHQDCSNPKKHGCKYCYYYYLYYYCCQYKCPTASSISKVETIYCLTKIQPSVSVKCSRNQCGVGRGEKKAEAEKLGDFAGDENQDIYSCYRLVPETFLIHKGTFKIK